MSTWYDSLLCDCCFTSDLQVFLKAFSSYKMAAMLIVCSCKMDSDATRWHTLYPTHIGFLRPLGDRELTALSKVP